MVYTWNFFYFLLQFYVWNNEFELIAAERKTWQTTEDKWLSKQIKYSQIDNEDIVSRFTSLLCDPSKS